MGNCVCMQGPGPGSRCRKRVVSGGGDSVKPFPNNAVTIHPLALAGEEDQKETEAAGELKVVRLKVVLTKAEAAQLLASGTIVTTMSQNMSSGASVLEQLAAELEGLSTADRVHSQQTGYGSCAWRPALESIPEVM